MAKRIDTRYTPRLAFVLDLGVKTIDRNQPDPAIRAAAAGYADEDARTTKIDEDDADENDATDDDDETRGRRTWTTSWRPEVMSEDDRSTSRRSGRRPCRGSRDRADASPRQPAPVAAPIDHERIPATTLRLA